MQEKKEIESNAEVILKLTRIIVILALCLVTVLIILFSAISSSEIKSKTEIPVPDSNGLFTDAAKLEAIELAIKRKELSLYWQAPLEAELNSNPKKNEILYGKDLIAHTSFYFGPRGKLSPGATNGMNCQNCHLEAGTKIFGNNYGGVASTYPKYRARSGGLENIYKRVNDCFERSLNGKSLDTTSREMQAIVAYIRWLGKDVKKGIKPKGSGFKELALLDRAADPEKGKQIYSGKCKSCHQENGEGQLDPTSGLYTYPPLWGDHSYNDGAGLYRISNFARYVKCNMPENSDFRSPQLSDEEAWDVAAFVNSQNRPHFDAKADWPKTNEKPYDHPFGPYADGFNEAQHKYGPFKPIQDKIKTLASK